MSRLMIIAALFCLVVPAALAAPPDGKGKPESSEASSLDVETNAAKACKAERGSTAQTAAAFTEKYGTNANKKNAFGKCVSMKVKHEEAEAEAQEQAEANAAKKCKTERGTTEQSIAAFRAKYGTNANKKNAFGKCVSKLAKQQQSSS